MPLHGLARMGASRSLSPSVSRFYLLFGFSQMRFESARCQLLRLRRLGHFRQRLCQLLFGMQQVAHLVDQEFVHGIRIGGCGGLGL